MTVWDEIVEHVAAAQQSAIESGHALWFRGHADSGFTLKSKLHRHLDAFLRVANLRPSDDDYRKLLHEEEQSLFQRFRSDAFALLDSEGRKPWGTLFTMQHHGLPTRLLDWTESFPCAVYFVNATRDPKQDSTIFLADPQAVNKHFISRDGMVNVEDGVSLGSFTTDVFLPNVTKPAVPLPTMAVVPIFSDERMRAQRARFLVMGDSRVALEEQDDARLVKSGAIQKIVLPAATYADSMKWLRVIGVRNSTFFPDLVGLKMDFEERRKYLNERGIAFAKGEE